MILSQLAHWHRYAALSPHLAQAFAYLEQPLPREPGRQEIDGEVVYAIIVHHQTTPLDERLFEAHRRYLDIHYVTSGSERLYWTPLQALTEVRKPYNEEADEALYGLVPNRQSFLLEPGQFAVFFPEDGHIPLCAATEPSPIEKVVLKVRL